VLAGVVVVVGGALLILGFFFLPGWKVRTRVCTSADMTPQLTASCLTAEQRLQAESNVRTAAVQALGGLAVLAAAAVAASVTWRGFKETRRLAIEARDHELRMAADERRQTR